MTDTAIIRGSLADVAMRDSISIAESFLSAEAIVLVDVSGSMASHDSRGRQARYKVALEELARLQSELPGKVAVIAFSDTAQFVPGGEPPMLGGGTDLAAALRFAAVADVPGMKFFVISDGYPDDADAALAVAATYRAQINSVFVGPESDRQGRWFLEQLAAAAGGQNATADRVVELCETVQRLMLAS